MNEILLDINYDYTSSPSVSLSGVCYAAAAVFVFAAGLWRPESWTESSDRQTAPPGDWAQQVHTHTHTHVLNALFESTRCTGLFTDWWLWSVYQRNLHTCPGREHRTLKLCPSPTKTPSVFRMVLENRSWEILNHPGITWECLCVCVRVVSEALNIKRTWVNCK